MNEKLKNLLKVSVSLSLFVFVIYMAGPSKIWNTLKNVNIVFFFPVILLGVVNVCLSSKKLQILLRAKGEKIGFSKVLKFYYIGTFFNAFLPTTIGGDVVKAHKISKSSKKSEEAYSSVFMERYMGVIAVVSLAVVSSLLYWTHLPEIILVIVYLLYLPGLFLSILFISKKSALKIFKPIYRPIIDIFEFIDLGSKLEKLYHSINRFKEKRKAILQALSISFLFHLILITNNFLVSKSVGMAVPFHYFLIIIPISVLVLFLPISIKGFGVRESLYVYFFTQVGASPAQAFSMSFLFQIVGLIGSGIGGLVYLFSKT